MVGISFLGNNAVFAQLVRRDDGLKIDHYGEIRLQQVLASINDVRKKEFQSEVRRIFSHVQHRLISPDHTFSVIIPSEWLHYYFIPVHSSLKSEEKQLFLDWEFSQRLGEFAAQMDTRLFPFHQHEEQDAVLSVAFPQGLLELLTTVAGELDILIESVEIDLFAGWNNFPKDQEFQYLCKFTENTIGISQFHHHVFHGAGIFSLNQADDTVRYLRGCIDNTRAKHFQRILRSILTGHIPEHRLIWIYGTGFPSPLQSLGRSEDNVRVVRPFSDWGISMANTAVPDEYTECRFTEVAGVLRTQMDGFSDSN